MRNLTTSLLVIVLIATLGLGWLFDKVYEQYNHGEANQDINAVTMLEKLGQNLADTLNSLPAEAQKQFVNHWQAQPYSLTLSNIKTLALPPPLFAEIEQGTPLLLESSSHFVIHYYLSSSSKILTLKSPLSLIKPIENSQAYLFTLLFYLLVLLLFLLWLYPLVRQLLTLRRAAKSFGEGDLSQRISVSSISYISDIEDEFNRMAQRIEDLIGDVKLLSTAVSHDLRTPLARIRFGIDTLQEEDDPQLRRHFEEKISDNVDEMTSLVETLLRYARLDQAMLTLNKVNLDFSALVASCIKAKSNQEKNITLVNSVGNFSLNADQAYLKILVNNLLENAIIYGNSQVRVELSKAENSVLLSIEDDGEGIDSPLMADIFKPFIRGHHQQKTIKGHGIGLAIVKRILDWHRGEIAISKSNYLSGAKFTVTLPTNITQESIKSNYRQ